MLRSHLRPPAKGASTPKPPQSANESGSPRAQQQQQNTTVNNNNASLFNNTSTIPITHAALNASANVFAEIHNNPSANTALNKPTSVLYADATEASFEPKVLVPFDNSRGRVPRRIEVERRRRLYESQDVAELLSIAGLVPEEVIKRGHQHLPLESFDDTSFDVRDAQEWMSIARSAPRPESQFLPARAFKEDSEGKVTLQPCRVVGWNEANNKLSVMWGATAVRGERSESISRIFVQLLAEDPVVFVQRLVNAERQRADATSWIKYRLCCDSMPTEGLSSMEPAVAERLRRLGTNIPILSKERFPRVDELTEDLIAELHLEWRRTHNRLLFQHQLAHDEGLQRLVQHTTRLTLEQVKEGPNGNSNNNSAAAKAAEENGGDVTEGAATESPAASAVPYAGYDYAERSKNFTFATYYSQDEVVRALTAVRNECIKVLERSLFDLPKERQIPLQAFEARQQAAMKAMGDYLTTVWKDNIVSEIKRCFEAVGKGWLNINEESLQVYEISKLKKFFTTVKFMMEDTLFELVYTSLNEFTAFFEEACDFTVEVTDMKTVTNRWPGYNPEDFIEKQPLFTIDLLEVDGSFCYSTSAERFEETIIDLFNGAIRVTNAIPQLEKFVMTQYFWKRDGDGPFLDTVKEGEERVCGLRDRVAFSLRKSLVPLEQYRHCYDELLDVVRLDKKEYITRYSAEEHTNDEVKDEIRKHSRARKDILAKIEPFIYVGNFVVDCQSFRYQVADKNQELAKLVMDYILKTAKKRTQEIREEFNFIVKTVERVPQNAEKLYDVKTFISQLPEKVGELSEKIEEMKGFYAILDGFQYGLTDDEFRHKWEAIGWPRQLDIRVAATVKDLVKTEEELHSRMAKDMEDFQKRVDVLQRVVATFSKYTDSKEADKVAAEVKTHGIEIRQCIEEARKFNSDQRLFGDQLTDYRNVFDLEKEFKPYSDLWLATHQWQDSRHKWNTDPFESIDPEDMDTTVTQTQKTMIQLAKTFKDKNAMLRIVEEIRASVEGFKPVVPIVMALRNQGMKQRHWDALSEKLGEKIAPGETILTVTDCNKYIPTRDLIVSHCEVAAKEWGIEKSIDTMRGKWGNRNFNIEAYKETRTFIVKDTTEITEVLDDQLNLTQQHQFSPFKAHFENELNEWERTLTSMSDIIEEWITCQRSWRYLQPIFDSPEMAVQMPKMHRVFEKVDKSWRKMMLQAHQNPNVLSYCTSGVKMLDVFRENNRQLEIVQKGLNDYLQEKRQAFPRFYFLSEDGLLEILSQAKDPLRIDDHIQKLFEFIRRMKWVEGASQPTIEGFFSQPGEYVPLPQPFRPEGNVEVWLKDFEQLMKEAVFQQVHLAYEDYPKEQRSKWVLKWPSQAVLAISQVFWTVGCESDLERRGNVKHYAQTLEKQLMDLVSVVQNPALTELQRINMAALITIENHAKDTVDIMAEAGTSSITSFDWAKQLRFYYENDGCLLRQVDATFNYGGEYLGNTNRLVVTPLTDRIYLTLTGALSLCLGGAPAGPAGTGKTETTKDLAKAMAKQCVVFNCQEGMTYKSMAKFFKGLAWSGAWACFDEFNRIDIEVLSVVAQQVTDLQQAALTKQYSIEFEESPLVVDPTYAIFITMNPGYAGRTELPDNLKVLFRPVACMVPDYALISEVRLFSYGYKKARALAQKVTMTFKLSSELLSSQGHYDFGMRAVTTVISAAGNNKREYPNESEDILLLRALRDSNVPKFLRDDILLFDGIIADLFPGVNMPSADVVHVSKAVEAVTKEMALQCVPTFITKCMQLYDVTTLRHGIMLVGPAGAGKTSAYKAVQQALTNVAAKQARGDDVGSRSYAKVYTHICNPKSVTMDQLYGAYDENQEWKDGVLGILFRLAAKYGEEGTLIGKHWLLFDGPVDAVWIETMNTVLDDNKKLCLVSSEIIMMNPDMTMIFEVEDLAVASPATVSRCGMIYMEPATCSPTDARVTSWVQSLPKFYLSNAETVGTFANTYLNPLIELVRLHLKEYVSSVDNNLVASFFNMMNAYIPLFQPPPLPGQPPGTILPERLAIINEAAIPLCFMSLVWSVGATCDENGRVEFDKKLRAMMAENGHGDIIPAEGSVYDYCYKFSANPEDEIEASWLPWAETQAPYALKARLPYNDILVPTTDTIRQKYILKHLLMRNNHVAVVGPTGTGKTVSINELIMGGLPEKFQGIAFTFSAQTTAGLVQDSLMSKLDKRRSYIYGAPAGKQLICFVDDANLPVRESSGAQPAIEILRQYLGHGGFYAVHPAVRFTGIIDVSLAIAMGPTGGGRNAISNRFMRFFNMISFPEMSDDSKRTILNTILLGGFGLAGADVSITSLIPQLVNASLSLFKKVSAAFVPTPNHVHYSFNMRDITRVFYNLYNAFETTDREVLVRMWLHENARVFADRLIDGRDERTFRSFLDEELKEKLGYEKGYEEAVPTERLIFGDYCSDRRQYEELTNMGELARRVGEYLTQYNEDNQPNMNLVMFLDAIEHVSRIARVLRTPNGHCLLLGMGGSGRKSMARLAISMVDRMDLFTVEISKSFGLKEWREALAGLIMKCGMDDVRVTFLFTDSQILNPTFLEDVASLLTSGDIPNVFDDKQMELINEKFKGVCMQEGLPATKLAMYARFNKEVRANLHLVLAFSPIGDVFRTRIRMFPALINCCTIDWFSDWPEEALFSVGKAQLDASGVSFDSDDQVRMIANVFTTLHQSASTVTERFFEETNRRSYVTPTSYLSLISTFLKLLTRKRKHVTSQRSRLVNGLDKLAVTETRVAGLEETLRAKQPLLDAKKKSIQEMLVQLSADKADADKQAEVVGEEEREATTKAKACDKIKRDCAEKLAAAEPALQEALRSLKLLKPTDITEMSSYKVVTEGGPIKVNLEAVGVLLYYGQCPREFYGGPPGKKAPDWFAAAKAKMAKANELIHTLVTQNAADGGYDKERMDDALVAMMQPYLATGKIDPVAAAAGSAALVAVCKWTLAMLKWFDINKTIIPLREQLAVAEAEYAVVSEALAATRANLKAVNDRVKSLEDQYAGQMAELKELEDEVELTRQQLSRAARLIDGLGGEKGRWVDSVAMYDKEGSNIVGDMLIAAGTVAYLGPLTSTYRHDLKNSWHEAILKLSIPCSESYEAVSTIGEPVEIQGWQVKGLPTDQLSVENAIIMQNSSSWPLLIDPQGQANAWLRNLYPNSTPDMESFKICRPSEERYMKVIEASIRLGLPCLLENVGETLDAALEPVLLRQTYLLGSTPHIRIGENPIPYDPNFKLYITTKLPNPRYTPETVVTVTLLNFFITPTGLEDQLLGKTVERERADLEKLKRELTESNAAKLRELKDLQDSILERLQDEKGDILENEVLIDALEQSKAKSVEIKEDLEQAAVTEKTIDATREKYRPHAFRGSLLFFCVSSISSVDPMYQFSLRWFMNLFLSCLGKVEVTSDDVDERVQNIMDFTTYNFFCNVCRSLFEAHKLTFSFVLCNTIIREEGKIDADEMRFLLTGATKSLSAPNPAPEWLNQQSWNEIQCASESLPAFAGFAEHVTASIAEYKALFDNTDAHRYELPAEWQAKATPVQRLVITRMFRMDKVTHGVQDFVSHSIGEKYIVVPPFNLNDVYNDSDNTTPLIFIISPGSDPMSDLLKFAEAKKMSKKLDKVSLGQGQGAKAEELLTTAMSNGQWVLLQNCHLATSWMPKLESIVEGIDEKVSKSFRLWLTSMPTDKFPVSVLQVGVKMTNEPPKGLRANVTRSFFGFKEDDLVHGSKPNDFRRLLYAQCLFHAVLQERRRFGPLGFNIAYEFNDSDRHVCVLQLRKFLDMYQSIPFDVLVFLTGEINYGGRVTDDWDRRTMMTLIKDFIHPKVLKDGYEFSPSPTYAQIEPGKRSYYLDHFATWPINPDPSIFGLHENADITCARNEANALLTTVLSLEAGSGGGGEGSAQSRQQMLTTTAQQIMRKMPEPFNVRKFAEKYPTAYDESMNTVLIQEAMRYNRVVNVINTTLKEFLRAIKGEVGMSAELEAISTSLAINAVPAAWAAQAYPSLMPLSGWTDDLVKRLDFINTWYEKGIPNAFWIGGLFFPQAFLTGTLQNYARKVKEPIDTIQFGFEVMLATDAPTELPKPENGAILYGFFMEGARWSESENTIVESNPKELYTSMPPIYFKPIVNKPPAAGVYRCPVYKTLTRAGTLSTTGHSTNFVLPIELPSNVDGEHWIKRGVACLVSLNFFSK